MEERDNFRKFIAIIICMIILFTESDALQLSWVVHANGITPQVSTLDAVTNLYWNENSSATVAWTGVNEANYYSVTVNVYDSDCLTLIGSEETGTTDLTLDVQQEIHNIVDDAEYAMVMVSVAVAAIKKQEETVISKSESVMSGLWEYRIVKIAIPTPTNVSLTEDLVAEFECDIENPEENVEYYGLSIYIGNEHCSSTYRSHVEWENGTARIDLRDIITGWARYFGVDGETSVKYAVTLYAKGDTYVSSKQSEWSNTLVCDFVGNPIPTPTDVSLTEDLVAEFECDIENPEENVDYYGLSVYIGNRHYSTNYRRSVEWENETARIDLRDIITDAVRMMGIYGETSIKYAVIVYAKGDTYVSSKQSEWSNTVVCDFVRTPIPTPINVSLSEDLVAEFECNIEKPEDNIEYYGLSIYIDNEHGSSNYRSTVEWENGTARIDLRDIITDWARHFGVGGETSVKYAVTLYAKGDTYVSSKQSEWSNVVVFNGHKSVERLTLTPANPLVCLGESYYLGKTTTPVDAYYASIVWSSDDESVVIVDENGQITGMAVGIANVTATIGEIASTVPVTVYGMSSNIGDEGTKGEITEVARGIINGIVNGEVSELEGTDVSAETLVRFRKDVADGTVTVDDVWVNFNSQGRDLEYCQQNWDYSGFLEWQGTQYGNDNDWKFGYGMDAGYEIGYTDTEGMNHHIGNIVEFNKEYEFVFDVPDGAIPELQEGKKRNYNAVRYHDEEYEVVDTRVDNNGKIIVKSDKYSEFILMYEDVDETVFERLVEKETHSATMGDVITINYYLVLKDGVSNPKMTAWLDEDSKTDVSGELQKDGRYKFRYSVAAPQMTSVVYSTFTAEIDDEVVTTEIETYSVREYAETVILSGKTSQTMKDLAAQMLNYGAYAQRYFNYNASDLANKNLEYLGYSTSLDSSVINENALTAIEAYDGEIKAHFTTNALIFESDMELKYYITLDEELDNVYMAYRLRDNGGEYKYIPLKKSETRYYATIKGIKAPLLPDVYETFICVKNGGQYIQISDTKYYSAECYATAIYQKSTDNDMRNAVVAMMTYCKAARIHFGLDE